MSFTEQFDSRLLSSFYLFLHHKLTKIGKGFTHNTDVILNQESDDKLPNYDVYPSKFGQWVFDVADTPGAELPSTQAGEIVDYLNGRILISADAGNPSTITRSFTSPTYNLYVYQEDLEVLVDRSLQDFREIYDNPKSFAEPYKYHSPAIFLSEASAQNLPFSLGGGDMNDTTIRAIVLSDNQWYTSSALSFLKDLTQQCMVLLDSFDDFPLNNLGALKDSYSYDVLISQNQNNNKPFVKSAYKSMTRSFGSLSSRQNATLWGGYVEFDIETFRDTRQELANL